MIMDPVVSAVLLGFVLGLQHATDPDHLVAVATIVTRERRFAAGARVGLLWGVGHTLTLAAAGTVVVAFNLTVSARLAARDLAGDAGILADALAAPLVRTITRTTSNGGEAHVHPSEALLAAWRDERRRVGLRALAVGAVHGMAGTAAVALLVLATLHTVTAAVVYLVVFGLGTIAGMTALTAAMAYPVVRLARLRRMREAMGVASGVAAIAFGCWYAARLV